MLFSKLADSERPPRPLPSSHLPLRLLRASASNPPSRWWSPWAACLPPVVAGVSVASPASALGFEFSSLGAAGRVAVPVQPGSRALLSDRPPAPVLFWAGFCGLRVWPLSHPLPLGVLSPARPCLGAAPGGARTGHCQAGRSLILESSLYYLLCPLRTSGPSSSVLADAAPLRIGLPSGLLPLRLLAVLPFSVPLVLRTGRRHSSMI